MCRQLFYRKYLIWGLFDVSSCCIDLVSVPDAVSVFVSQQEAYDLALSHSGDVSIGQVVDLLIHMTHPWPMRPFSRSRRAPSNVQYLEMWRCS